MQDDGRKLKFSFVYMTMNNYYYLRRSMLKMSKRRKVFNFLKVKQKPQIVKKKEIKNAVITHKVDKSWCVLRN